MTEESGTRIGLYTCLAGSASGASVKETKNAKSTKSSKKDSGKSKPAAPATPAVAPEVAEKRFQVLRSIAEECITDSDLKNLVSKKAEFRLYDGFEPSGRMHIAQGVFKAINVNKATSSGGTFVFWIADWFALMNDKMGGDLEKIKTVGKYLVEVFKAVGMDMDHVEFRWASDDINNNAQKYWGQVIDIAKRFTVSRITKCCQIMGRLENSLTAAQILYPLMQCADVFFLRANICQLGLDQRKVNMLAREYCDSVGIKLKPVILSHHMLYGLKQGQEKMSKSDPDSAVFMEDTEEDIRRKITKAYCPTKPEGETKKAESSEYIMHIDEDELKNPCLDYIKHLVMNGETCTFNANGKVYSDYEKLRADFIEGVVSEKDLKEGLITAINNKIAPVRKHFEENKEAKEVFELVQKYKRTAKLDTMASFRRHDIFKDVDAEVAAVVAPVVKSTNISLGIVLSLVKELKKCPEGNHKVLIIPDLSALAQNSFGADKKTDPLKLIKAAYQLVVGCLNTLIPDLMKSVYVYYQSEAMLLNPSDYWISVINVGRHFQLQTVLDANGNAPTAGGILAALLFVADIVTTNPARVICSRAEQCLLHELAVSYINGCGQTIISSPTVIQIPRVSTKLKEGDDKNVNFLGGDLYITDTVAEIKKKVKQAFCAEGNIDFCPPLELAKWVAIDLLGSVTIGENKYENGDALVEQFASMKIHPSELKPGVQASVQTVWKNLEKALNTEPFKTAKADLAKYAKKISKKK